MAKAKVKAKTRTYSVMVTRDRTLSESVEMEIIASSTQSAEELALKRAEDIPSEEWQVDDENIGTLCAESEEPDDDGDE
jgi:hypothetical protein